MPLCGMEKDMANETVITVVGNLTASPELRFTPNGAAVVNFTVASTPRTFDRQSNQWVDGEALFLRCSVWRESAENVADSLDKGMRVIVQGRLKARTYDDRDGNKRTSWEMDVDEIGPALRFATAKVTRNPRNNGGGNYQGGGFGGPPQGGQQNPQNGYQQGGQQGGGTQGGGFGGQQYQQGGGFGGPQQGGQSMPQGQDPWNGQGAPEFGSAGEPPF